jgi:hypothetical protein
VHDHRGPARNCGTRVRRPSGIKLILIGSGPVNNKPSFRCACPVCPSGALVVSVMRTEHGLSFLRCDGCGQVWTIAERARADDSGRSTAAGELHAASHSATHLKSSLSSQ